MWAGSAWGIHVCWACQGCVCVHRTRACLPACGAHTCPPMIHLCGWKNPWSRSMYAHFRGVPSTGACLCRPSWSPPQVICHPELVCSHVLLPGWSQHICVQGGACLCVLHYRTYARLGRCVLCTQGVCV